MRCLPQHVSSLAEQTKVRSASRNLVEPVLLVFGRLHGVDLTASRRSYWGVPRIGIVGNQRIWFRKQQGISETDLHPIRSQLLAKDLAKMIGSLFRNGGSSVG
jgi:hypothetical protein